MTTIRRLTAEDALACDAIIARLPYFFSLQAGIETASRDIRNHQGWVTEDEGGVTEFLTVERATPAAIEISWLAVHPDYRRGGRGRTLVETATKHAVAGGASMLFLFTSADADPPGVTDGYEGTRRFYESLGFVGLWRGRQAGWSEDHLLMVRPLLPPAASPFA